VQKNIRSFVHIKKLLEKKEGKATLIELQECMNYTDGEEKVAHVDFVSYLIRLGHLVEGRK
jgi:hypothetical protein